MPKVVHYTDDDIAWFTELANDPDVTTQELISMVVEHLGCCRDTARRIIHRNDIVDLGDSAKLAKRRDHEVVKWDRPCITCGVKVPRPKWQYRCDGCWSRWDRDALSLPEDMIVE